PLNDHVLFATGQNYPTLAVYQGRIAREVLGRRRLSAAQITGKEIGAGHYQFAVLGEPHTNARQRTTHQVTRAVVSELLSESDAAHGEYFRHPVHIPSHSPLM